MAALLSVPLKETGFLPLADAISKYLKSSVSKQAEKDGAGEATEAQLLRNTAAERTGSPEEIKAKLLRYYAYLNALEAALPIGRERGGVQISFQWGDAFQPRERHSSSSVAFEKAALLFNVGAIAAQDALSYDISTDAGVKAAAKRFQEAAGVFAHLGGSGLVNRMPPPIPADLAPECTALLATLCLAQAQELTYLKAAADSKSSSLLARIAKQVEVHYSVMQAAPKSDALRRNLGRSLLAHLVCKSNMFEALALQHQAEAFIAADECGKQIACLQEAVRLTQSARKEGSSGHVDAPFLSRLSEMETQLAAALAKANRENGSVYLQRIADIQSIPPLLPAPLVQPQTLPEDLDRPDPRWFQYLRNSSGPDGPFNLLGFLRGIVK